MVATVFILIELSFYQLICSIWKADDLIKMIISPVFPVISVYECGIVISSLMSKTGIVGRLNVNQQVCSQDLWGVYLCCIHSIAHVDSVLWDIFSAQTRQTLPFMDKRGLVVSLFYSLSQCSEGRSGLVRTWTESEAGFVFSLRTNSEILIRSCEPKRGNRLVTALQQLSV